jgi:type I restriction enzyme R subunit
LRALYNNLKKITGTSVSVGRAADPPSDYTLSSDPALILAMRIDAEVKRVRPDGWRGIQARENTIKAALLPLLNHDEAEVERIFPIVKAQSEY